MLTARQSGKSTYAAGKSSHIIKHEENALVVVIADSYKHSRETVKKVEEIVARDSTMPKTKIDNMYEKEYENGSRIIALPGSEKSVRGFSGPRLIIFDEAARIEDLTYKAARPMMAGTDCEVILTSTSFGQRGFFYERWNRPSPNWRKIMVLPRYKAVDNVLVENEPLEQLRARLVPQGIEPFYSERHSKDFLEEELEELGEEWFNQEYGCEFLQPVGGLFNYDQVLAMVTDKVNPLLLTGEAIESEMLGDLEVLTI